MTATEDEQPTWNQEALFQAIDAGDVAFVQTCLQQYPELLNAENDYGTSPLMQACRKNQRRIASCLLKQGANPNYFAKAGESALLWAFEKGDVGMIHELMQAGFDVNTKDFLGQLVIAEILLYGIKSGKERDLLNVLHPYEPQMTEETLHLYKKARLFRLLHRQKSN